VEFAIKHLAAADLTVPRPLRVTRKRLTIREEVARSTGRGVVARVGRRSIAMLVGTMIGVSGVAVPQARSACVDAEIYVTRQGQDPVFVYGEHDPCVTPTPWNHSFTHHGELTRTGLPDGAPNGYWVDLRIPAP
jgi:hypothetical protein